jgi:hypothetical protein
VSYNRTYLVVGAEGTLVNDDPSSPSGEIIVGSLSLNQAQIKFSANSASKKGNLKK